MKFHISTTYLLKHLQILGGVIGSNTTMPILDNFLFELLPDKLQITASDLETTMSIVLNVQSDSEGRIAIPAKLLIEILKTFPEQPLTFIINEGAAVTISSTQGKYAIAYTSGDEYPKPIVLEDASSTALPGSILAKAIHKTIFATNTDENRGVMCGVLFQFTTEGLVFAATDAHKLVQYARNDIRPEETAEFVMPKKSLTLLKGILSGSEAEVNIEYNKINAKFTFDNIELVCQLIDGKYPNYEVVIPKENPNVLHVPRQQILNCLKRVSIFSSKSTNQVRFNITESNLLVSAEDLDFANKAEESLTCDYQGDDMEIGFNSKFLIEMLNNLDSEDIQIRMSLPERAGILTPADGQDEGEHILMIVMPVLIRD